MNEERATHEGNGDFSIDRDRKRFSADTEADDGGGCGNQNRSDGSCGLISEINEQRARNEFANQRLRRRDETEKESSPLFVLAVGFVLSLRREGRIHRSSGSVESGDVCERRDDGASLEEKEERERRQGVTKKEIERGKLTVTTGKLQVLHEESSVVAVRWKRVEDQNKNERGDAKKEK